MEAPPPPVFSAEDAALPLADNAANADADDSAIARLDWYSQLQNVADLSTLKEELTLIVKDNVQTLLGVF